MRAQRTEDAKAALGEAKRAETEAAHELDTRTHAVATHELRTSEVIQGEAARLRQGSARAADLHAQASWQVVEAERAAQLKREEDAARATLEERTEARAVAHASLVACEVERKVVETHRDKQARLAARAADNAADEEILEAWKPRA